MRFFLLLLSLAPSLTSTAQPTWRFHLAFEDGTGARDTIWMVYDTAAQLFYSGEQPLVDSAFGEGPVDFNPGDFHVFLQNALLDTTQTNALPYSIYPIHEGTVIDALNWSPPMTITWDTSLFHAPYLPYGQGNFNQAYLDGNYFFFHSNDGSKSGFNMLITDSVVVDEDAQYLFPFSVYFGPDDHVGLPEEQAPAAALSLWPNPAASIVHLAARDKLSSIRVLDLSGRTVMQVPAPPKGTGINIAGLSPGAYFVRARSTTNQLYHGQFQKVD